MRYLSVCSGIEAASVAWDSLGWTPIGVSEIDKFPSDVLSTRYPDVPNFGDMAGYKEWDIARDSVDLIVGGTPCQSFSVAGLRKGLDDPRGNLMLVYVSMVEYFRPEWIVWENVPGVLSSNEGRDFGTLLGALAHIGYGWSYRVLDAQYFGVPQRRRRVFLVGHSSGDPRRAAEILFEPESLQWHSSASRNPRQKTSTTIETGTAYAFEPGSIARNAGPSVYESHPNDSRVVGPVDICPTVVARWGTGGGNTPLVHQAYRKSRRAQNTEDYETWVDDGVANTLNCFDVGDVRSTNLALQPVIFQQNTREEVRLINGDGAIAGALSADSGMHQQNFVAQAIPIQDIRPIDKAQNGIGVGNVGDPSYTLDKMATQGVAVLAPTYIVRRLMPIECERLQGFPDGWTDIRDNTPDSPRYKAIGNSMAVPCMKWIGKRINDSNTKQTIP